MFVNLGLIAVTYLADVAAVLLTEFCDIQAIKEYKFILNVCVKWSNIQSFSHFFVKWKYFNKAENSFTKKACYKFGISFQCKWTRHGWWLLVYNSKLFFSKVIKRLDISTGQAQTIRHTSIWKIYMEKYCYANKLVPKNVCSVLTSQVQTWSNVVAILVSLVNAQKIFRDTFNVLIIEFYSLGNDIENC